MNRLLLSTATLAASLLLAACAGGPAKPKPAELGALPQDVRAQVAWSVKLGAVTSALRPQVNGNRVTVAGGDGVVVQLDASSGRELWRHAVGAPLLAGVGSDGQTAAVVTQSNDLVVLRDGKPAWRQRLPAQAHTAPLVAGARAFVLTADRVVNAYDGQTGARLWSQQRPGSDPLVLRQPGVLMPVGDTLVVGLTGRMLGLNPLNGTVRWDAPVAIPRGINEIERLVDLVEPAACQANTVCARAFQAAIACVNTDSGSTLWSRPADGTVGLATDGVMLFGAEANGDVLAWRRVNGERIWSNERLRFRDLTAPLVVGRSVVFGDYQGHVHFLAREDGRLLGRLPTDGSAVLSAPVMAGETVVVTTRAGGVFGVRLQ